MKYLTPFARPPPGRPDSAQSRSTESDYLLSPSPTSSRHRYSSVSTRTNDSSPTITRTVTPIPLEFSELPDPFVPKDEWAVVNVSGQRFHINMDHVKLHHPTTLLGSADFEKIYWDQQRSEYFIDRHRGTFEVISSFLMRGGSLIRPDIIPIDIFLSELTFYRLSYSAIKDFLDIEVPFFVSHFNYLYNLDRMDCKLRPEDFVYDPKKESSEHEGLRAFELNLAEAVRHSVSGFNKGNANSREVLAPLLPFSRTNDDECVPPLEYDQKVIKSNPN
ncbi:Oidioi.mRNA.OKI2018_I69.chr2.g7935.t1.cds [Oikopleura dioica]|uniref:Oidioi.mRNA.OKI2018_I69.chr2.g7935.t1.cds n=1 Tax=Oikopleura dioica TaxID=34765 RepID=A0ABN7TCF8_OIKDI|nr:Oidioi.mRNA.OKI2018_I69.chr2.g7935.t1.cds [Oikopleura dioica]